MKVLMKAFPLIACLTLFSMAVQAQTYGGLRVGVNNATWQFGDEPEEDYTAKIGFVGGLVIEAGLNSFLAIQPEINFIQKGYFLEVKPNQGNDEASFSATLNYIEVPVLAKLRLGSEAFRLNILAGPTAGFGLSGQTKIKATLAGNTVETQEELDFSDSANNRIDLGLALGAGLSIGLGDGGFVFLDARYGLGLSDFANDDPDDAQVYNRGIQLSLGFLTQLSGN